MQGHKFSTLIKNLFRASIESSSPNTPDTSLSLPEGVLYFFGTSASTFECLVQIILVTKLTKHQL